MNARLAALLAAAATAVLLAAPARAAAGTPRMYFGAVGNSPRTLARQLGARVANHAYGQLTGYVPPGRMITMRDNGVPWARIAAAGPGSSIYANIVRWAQTLKARRGTVFFAYHHEPEASGSATYGSPSDYIRAYRHVVRIFRAQGARNVRFTWQMTSYAFQVSGSDPRAAARWYPGNAYVDLVGSDGYNWFDWPPGRGNWVSLASVEKATLLFARAHHKRVVVAEFGCAVDPRRATWMRQAHRYLAAHRGRIAAAFYFQSTNGHDWPLRTAAEKRAFDAIAHDRANFRI